jgi:hypothetical protein
MAAVKAVALFRDPDGDQAQLRFRLCSLPNPAAAAAAAEEEEVHNSCCCWGANSSVTSSSRLVAVTPVTTKV